jgi:mRNA-degrading endonuclease RelE of RelBE toxin-antitoxin system
MNSSTNFKVAIAEEAQKEAKYLLKKYPSFKVDLAGLIESLKSVPQQGEPLGKDCYKIRFAISDKRKPKRRC